MTKEDKACLNAHILVVDDSATRRALYAKNFRTVGYQISLACDGLEAIQQIGKIRFDLVLIDQDMPNITGMEVIEWMRGAEINIPVILMTGYNSDELHIRSLRLGGDDYLQLPVSFDVILARVEARLKKRSFPAKEQETVGFADVEVNTRSHIVHRGDHLLELTPKEYRLLVLFLKHPALVLSREQIIQRVWEADFEGPVQIVDQYVRTLRKKLEAFEGKRLIQTVRGFGYVLRETQAERQESSLVPTGS